MELPADVKAFELFRRALDVVSDSVMLIALEDLRFVWVNKAFLSSGGFSQDEIVGHTVSELGFWDEPAIAEGFARSLAEEGRLVAKDVPVKGRDGDIRFVWFQGQTFELDGRALVLATGHDVTEQKVARDELLRRDIVLRAVADAAQRFLAAADWRECIDEVLGSLGLAEQVSRVYIFRNHEGPGGEPFASMINEWVADGIAPQLESPQSRGYPYTKGFSRWMEVLGAGGAIQGRVRDFPEEERPTLVSEDILSVAAVPLAVGGAWWGFLGFDECANEREWSPSEIEALRAAAGILGAAIERGEVQERLREVEATHRALIERIPAVVYTAELGQPNAVTYVSPQYVSLIGYTPEERLADRDLWRRMIHPEDLPFVIEESVRTNETEEPFALEYRMRARDGRILWVRDESVIVRDQEGSGLYWLGLLTDVTTRRRAEDEVLRHDAILQAVAFAADTFLNAGSWTDAIDEVLARLGSSADVSRAYIFENHVLEDGTPVTSQRFEWCAPGIRSELGNPDLQGFPRDGTYRRWDEVLRSGGTISGPVRSFPRREQDELGREGILSLLSVPISVEGEWWGYLGFDDCITEREWSQSEIEALRSAAGIVGAAIRRHVAEERLREAEERHRSVVETIPAVVYRDALDEVSAALYISPQVESLLGYPPEEHVSEPRLWVDHLHPADRERVLAENQRTNRTGDPFAADYRMIKKDGGVVWVHDESLLVRDADGKPRYWQGVMVDITNSKRAEEELQKALEMEREAADRLRALDEMKNTFLTAVSHDLRTPLAAVLGLALTLERDDMSLEPHESQDLARRIAANARKLDRLVTDLLDLDRLSRGILEPKLSTTDIGLLVRKVVDEADFLHEHPVAVEAESVVAKVDTAKIERIVENLLANTARHTPPGTPVWVRVARENGNALISVEDAGPGVLSELRDAVFEPFRQGTDGAVPSPGVGIGLSLVARFAELHGGRAWVEDRVGGGASFKVALPIVPPGAPPI